MEINPELLKSIITAALDEAMKPIRLDIRRLELDFREHIGRSSESDFANLESNQASLTERLDEQDRILAITRLELAENSKVTGRVESNTSKIIDAFTAAESFFKGAGWVVDRCKQIFVPLSAILAVFAFSFSHVKQAWHLFVEWLTS